MRDSKRRRGNKAALCTYLTFHQPSKRASNTSTFCSFFIDSSSGAILA